MAAAKKDETVADWSRAADWSSRSSLKELVEELDRQKESKIDFIADSRELAVIKHPEQEGVYCLAPDAVRVSEWLPSSTKTILRDEAMCQLGERLDPTIPRTFLRTLSKERPERFLDLMNGLLKDTGKRRLIRCMDGQVRAVLSDKYRVIDNHDIAFAALDAVRSFDGEVIECAISEKHMRIKFTSRKIFDAIDEMRTSGDKSKWYAGGMGNQEFLSKVGAKTQGELPGGPGTVHPLVTISNSETGHGGFNVRIGILRAICFNLATIETVAAKIHLGSKMELGIFQPETIESESKTIFLKARDAIHSAFDPIHFKRLIAKCKVAQNDPIEAPGDAIDNVIKANSLPQETREHILAHFLRDYDQTRYGLSQAVSRYAQDVDSPDAADQLEVAAGRLITA